MASEKPWEWTTALPIGGARPGVSPGWQVGTSAPGLPGAEPALALTLKTVGGAAEGCGGRSGGAPSHRPLQAQVSVRTDTRQCSPCQDPTLLHWPLSSLATAAGEKCVRERLGEK